MQSMHAMQYEITLPADYDMGIIHDRVATRGALLDTFPGLGLKAYCVRERGVDGSPVNQYAPFYLWVSVTGMNSFLWGSGFRGIISDFGRPAVQHWTGLAFHPGPALTATPRAATQRRTRIPYGEDPASVIDQALERVTGLATHPGVHSTALAVDPRHWELTHFTLWEQTPTEEFGDRYQVLHLSTPQLLDLRVGRHW
ncbi:DUF4865 family protein [Actinopolymorpha pittospori]